MYASKFGPVMEEMLTIRHRSGLQLKFIGFFLDDLQSRTVWPQTVKGYSSSGSGPANWTNFSSIR